MENFDLKKYLAEGKLLKEEPKPYTDEIRRDEVDGLAADIELDGDAKQMFMGDLMKATEGESWDTFYDIADEIMSKYLAEGKTLNESAPGYDTRKQGEALPTLESVKAAYEAKNDIKEDVLEEAYTFADANDDNVKAIQKELIPVLKASIEKALMDWAKKNPDNEYGKADFGRAVGMIAFDSLN